jgi:chromosome segregation ATPase
MEALAKSDEPYTQGKSFNVAEHALKAMQASQGLHELLDPLIGKVYQGLASMGKIVGSSTHTKQITPDQLAVALSVKERRDNEIVLPLIEISEIVSARRTELEAALKNQAAQLESLKANIATLKDGMASIRDKAEVAKKNAAALAVRSSSALQSSKDLLPTLTQAEFDYMQELRRLDSKTQSWLDDCSKLENKVSTILEEDTSILPLTLPPESIGNCRALLNGSEKKMKVQKEKLKKSQITLEDVIFETGLDLGPEKPLSSAQ